MEEVANKIVETAELLDSKKEKQKSNGYRNILSLIISGLLALLSIVCLSLIPSAVKSIVDSSIESHISGIKESQEEMRLDIESIKDFQLEDILESGIAAYEKFKGLAGEELKEKLKSSTQNARAARRALMNPSVRNILFLSDRELTLELEEYFNLSGTLYM